jgi:hypothetical protein
MIVFIPGSALGMLTEGVQVLAGGAAALAAVFLLLRSDSEVPGSWTARPACSPSLSWPSWYPCGH